MRARGGGTRRCGSTGSVPTCSGVSCTRSQSRKPSAHTGRSSRRQRREIAEGPPRILVVEDEEVTRARLHAVLDGAGYRVVMASDGAEALFHLSRDTFDVILADIWMPLLDGIKLLEVVRDKRPGTPVVLLTGHSKGELEARCLAMGAADYVTKPFDDLTLLARLGKAMGSV